MAEYQLVLGMGTHIVCRGTKLVSSTTVSLAQPCCRRNYFREDLKELFHEAQNRQRYL